MKRDEVLDRAKKLINGERAEDYGDAFENIGRVAEGWNLIMGKALKTHGYLTPAHVCLMMDWLKTSRLLANIDKLDSWVDKAGYTALGAELMSKEVTLEQILEESRSGKKSSNGDVRT